MTVSTLTNKVVYLGNGSATSFAVPFKVLDEDHLVVQRRVEATGAIAYTYVGTDYSYSGLGNDSGTLTLDGPALSDVYELVIERIVPYTQELDLVNAGGFYPETVEEQLDLTTMQIQQIGAQSDDIEERAIMVPIGEEAPDYNDFVAGLRGSPGGDASQVGTYAAAQGMEIAASISKISLTDRDNAIFERVVEEPSHPGSLRSQDRFLPDGTEDEDDGGWWELARSQLVSFPMLGAERWSPPSGWRLDDVRTQVALGCPDSTVALLKLRPMIDAGYRYFNVDGIFGTTETVPFGATSITTFKGAYFQGQCIILALAAMGADPVCLLENVGTAVWAGSLQAGGIGNLWADRTCWYGIISQGWNSYFKIDGIYVAGFKADGFLVNGGAGDSQHFISWGHVAGYACGSGVVENNLALAYYLEATCTRGTDEGSSNSTNQYTIMTGMSVDIPEELDDYQESGHLHIWALVGGYPYAVKAFDRTANTINLYPWVDSSITGAITIQLVFGGVAREIGGDSGTSDMNGVVGRLSSIAYTCTAQYPSNVSGEVSAQSCCFGLTYRTVGHEQRGGVISSLYCEGTTWHLVLFNGDNNHCVIHNASPVDVAKIIVPHRHAGGTRASGAMDATSSGFSKFRLKFINGEEVRSRRQANDENVVVMDSRGERIYCYGGSNSPTINFSVDLNILRLAGGRMKQVLIPGLGTRGEPTGTVTLTHTGYTITLDGGVAAETVQITGAKTPIVLYAEANRLTGNVTLTYVNRPAVAGWGTPTGTPTRTTFDTTSVTLPQLAERVKALVDDLLTRGEIGS